MGLNASDIRNYISMQDCKVHIDGGSKFFSISLEFKFCFGIERNSTSFHFEQRKLISEKQQKVFIRYLITKSLNS